MIDAAEKRTQKRLLSWVCSALLCFATVAALAESAPRRPNFLLILTDDQGWSQVSRSMHPDLPEGQSAFLRTPNIDRIGIEGVRFSSGYAPAPLCTPTRRSILCGTTAARSGTEFESPWRPAAHLTIPKALKQVDPAYRSAHFGKWGENLISTPEECGFDASDGLTGNFDGGTPKSLNPTVADAAHDNTPPFYLDESDPKLTTHITDRALGFMRESVEMKRPFYVQASYYAIHLSIVCREKTLNQLKARGTPDREYTHAWAAMLEEMDAAVGRLLDGLKEMGIADNTYVVFTSDNGGHGSIPGRDTARFPANHPLTGHKHQLYEGGIRVPFLVSGPNVPAGETCHVPVAAYDFLPTFYDLAGGKAKLPAEIDGASLKPLLHKPGLRVFDRPNQALIFHRPGRRVSAIRQGEYKLMLFWERTGAIASRELYRFAPDPREEGRDISREQAAKADKLQHLLVTYLKSVNAETPLTVPRKKSRGDEP